MSYEKFMASFEKLDRDMTQCEKLAKLIGGKMDETRRVQKSKSDATRKTTSSSLRPQPVQMRSSSSTRKSAPERIVTGKKPVETSTKPKTVETGARRRSSSVAQVPGDSCKCPSVLRTQPKHPSQRPTHSSKVSSMPQPPPPPLFRDQRASAKSPVKHKHLSWGEILSQNHGHKDTKTSNHDAKSARSKSAPYSTKHPHDCAGPVLHRYQSGDAHDSHSYGESRQTPHHPSLSSEESSGFSSNTDVPVNVTSKSVQCSSLPLAHEVLSKPRKPSTSTSSGASCRMDDEEDEGKGLLASDAYAMFNPVRTLNFLVRELHGRLIKAPKEDHNSHRIVAEMQRLLQRLPEDGFLDTPTVQSHGSKPSNLSGSTLSLDSAQGSLLTQLKKRPLGINEAEKDIVEQTLASCPNIAKKIDEKTRSLSKKIAEVNPLLPVPLVPEVALSKSENALFFQKYMEVSCEQLGKVTIAMEEMCDELRKEKETLESTLLSKEEELRKLQEREKDYITALNTLRRNLESLTLRESQTSEENKKLQEQVQEIPALRAAQVQVRILQEENEKLKEENKMLPGLKFIEEKYQAMAAVNCNLVEENKRLQASLESMRRQKGLCRETCTQCLRMEREVQTMKLEREKLLVLFKAKDAELEHHRREVQDIQRLVEEQLMVVQDGGRVVHYSVSPPASFDFSTSSGSGSASASGSGSGSEQEEGAVETATLTTHPICSSPNASNFKGFQVDECWKNMSTILPEATQLSPDVEPLPRDTSEETFKSLERDPEPWQKGLPDPHNEASSSETQRQRQRLSVQRSREWLRGQEAVAHSDGVRSDGSGDQHVASTKDIRSTLHQLLKIVQRQQQRQGKKGHEASGETSSTVPETSGRVLRVEMPILPSPPKFLDPPEFSDFSSISSSLADSRSPETDNLPLEDKHKRKHKKK